ncbi:plasminogen activator inhibitor 2, macrophage [Solenopsis invicta]|uniref:plasminogen activator inhibitor 2, macrophage n=1 Tax=Solenopsis invicta TaxID=13686 RepID=UPI000595C3AF|nr:plasminogen activator inhibitor 2, macrophage [Solenopsis invicta]
MLTESRFKFALECLKQCLLIEPRSNVFFSPSLIYEHLLTVCILCNTYNVPSGDRIENSLKKILYIPENITKMIVQKYYLDTIEKFNYWIMDSTGSYKYGINNVIWIENKLIARKRSYFKRHYRLSLSGLFWFKYQKLRKVRFDNSRYSTDRRDDVNTFIKDTTGYLIENLLPPNSIHDKTNLVMANVAYLKAKINCEFDPNVGHSSKNVEGTNLQLNANITQLRLKDDRISILFLTPILSESEKDNIILTNDRIVQMIEQLMTEEGYRYLRQILDHGESQQISNTFPTFKIVQDLRMYDLLKILDVEELTPLGAANLNPMTYLGAVRFGDAMHRVNVDITENSVIATASNVLFTHNSSRHERINTVDCSNSCVCFIYDKHNSNILFCGVLFKAENQQQCDAAGTSECCSGQERL